MVQQNKISKEVELIAQKILMGTWHSDIRTAAMKLFGKSIDQSLGSIDALVKVKGNKDAGQNTFKTYCSI